MHSVNRMFQSGEMYGCMIVYRQLENMQEARISKLCKKHPKRVNIYTKLNFKINQVLLCVSQHA